MTNSEIKMEAKELVRGNRGVFILGLLIIGALSSLSTLPYIGYVGSIIYLILSGPLMLGMASVALVVATGGKAKAEELFSGFKNFVTAFVAGLLQSIYLALWSLLIIPIFIKPFSYALTFYILRDNPEMSGNEAITRSREMMDGNKWKLFCLHFSFIGWYLLGILTLGILYFWLVPYVKTAEARFYLDVKERYEEYYGEEKVEKSNKCPICGTVNEAGNKYCEKCGEELGTKEEVVAEKTTITCPTCGTENEAESKYCSHCGEELKK